MRLKPWEALWKKFRKLVNHAMCMAMGCSTVSHCDS
jgi:hypothetical protein